MRVVHVSRFFHPAIGGTENVIASLARGLDGLGIESVVIVSARRRDEPGPAPHIDVIEVPVWGSNRFPLPVGRYRRIVRAFMAADVIHVHDVRFLFELAQVLGLVLDKPLVVTTHGLIFHTEDLSGVKQWLWRHYYARALGRAEHVVAASERDAVLCRAAGLSENLTVIHNPIDVEAFLKEPEVELREPGRLFSFGRIAREKSVERLAGVLDVGPTDWCLRVGGSGDPADVSSLRQRLAPFGDRAHLLGYQTTTDLADELARCACVLLPSRQEAFGLTLVEAMAAGAPIVASDIAAYRELADGSGVTFADFDDPVAVARAIQTATESHDPSIARARAVDLAGANAVQQYAKIYERATTAQARPPGRHRILGVDVEALDQESILDAVDQAITADATGTRPPVVIANHNLHSAALHRHDPLLRRFYQRADHVFIDGMPLVWFGRLTGHPLTPRHRTTWIDLIDPLADLIAARGWRLMIIAGTDDVVDRGGQALRDRHPTLNVRVLSGHFDMTPESAANDAVLAEVTTFRPHILFVGMGMPRQEHWIDAHRDELATSVIMNMGGLLDYVAGTKVTPPRWLAARGFEWLARLLTEPRRLAHRYLVEPWTLLPGAARELLGATARRVRRGS